jgi:hypothetical protein
MFSPPHWWETRWPWTQALALTRIISIFIGVSRHPAEIPAAILLIGKQRGHPRPVYVFHSCRGLLYTAEHQQEQLTLLKPSLMRG